MNDSYLAASQQLWQHCPNCSGGGLKIIAAIFERPVIEKILTLSILAPQPPPKSRVGNLNSTRLQVFTARGPGGAGL